MNTMRVNTLSYVRHFSQSKRSTFQPVFSCFLAIKHASAAMLKTNPSRGKDVSGGSIIMTASGKLCSPNY